MKGETLKGFFWSAVDGFSSQMMNFIIGIILARLLSPSDFGLIGMITVFTAISQIFVNSGINEALIRRKTVDDIYYSTALIFNVATSTLIYFILFLSSPFIAAFYDQFSLSNIIRVLSITLIINAFSLVHMVQITRRIDFKILAKITLFANLLSGSISITLAYFEFGVWSLVWRSIILSIATVFMLWMFNNWRPSWKFSFKSLQELFGFGSRLMVLGLIDTIYNNIYFLIIGKFYTADQLGQYSRAETFKRLPTQGLTQVIQRVSYPLMSKLQDDKIALKSTYRRLIRSSMLLVIVGMFLLSIIARDLTVVLMGQEWNESGIFLQILCFSAIFYPLDALNSNILKVMNRSDLILRIGILRKLMAVPLILVMIFIGILPFLYVLILYNFLSFLLISNFSKGYIDYGTRDQIRDIYPIILIMGIITFVLSYIGPMIELTASIRMLILFTVGTLLTITFFEFRRDETYMYLKSILLEMFYNYKRVVCKYIGS